ncbi:phage tail tube protein [Vreelandella titanicae]|uniref:Uncharacterized protein n=1 Tax=Vreelandella titanicae TaxID=664683 RepID=A0AAP9NMX6_9GAMM|nr:phage tail tube protein [Halomonas titanicae]QKS24595.1 hypothetical protein FX987_02377 [Halomonas titanicae]
MANYLLTKGTHLYIVDSANAVHDISCSAISGVGGSRNTNTIQTLQDEAATIISGSMQPSSMSFTIYLHGSAEQKLIQDLYQTATVVDFAIGMSDGVDEPTYATALELPATRSWISFRGFVTDFPLEFAVDSAVECTITVQMEGAYTLAIKE